MIQRLISNLYLWNLIHYTSMDRMFLVKWDIWYTIDWCLKINWNLMVCTTRGHCHQVLLLCWHSFHPPTPTIGATHGVRICIYSCVPFAHDFNYCSSCFFILILNYYSCSSSPQLLVNLSHAHSHENISSYLYMHFSMRTFKVFNLVFRMKISDFHIRW
jgi:hypothetical protein